MRGEIQLNQTADGPAFQLSCAVRRNLFSSATRATGLLPDTLYEEAGQRGYAHATLLQLTQSCILQIMFPENASAAVTHLQYTLCPWLANQRVLGSHETNQQRFFLAISSKRHAPLDLHLVSPRLHPTPHEFAFTSPEGVSLSWCPTGSCRNCHVPLIHRHRANSV